MVKRRAKIPSNITAYREPTTLLGSSDEDSDGTPPSPAPSVRSTRSIRSVRSTASSIKPGLTDSTLKQFYQDIEARGGLADFVRNKGKLETLFRDNPTVYAKDPKSKKRSQFRNHFNYLSSKSSDHWVQKLISLGVNPSVATLQDQAPEDKTSSEEAPPPSPPSVVTQSSFGSPAPTRQTRQLLFGSPSSTLTGSVFINNQNRMSNFPAIFQGLDFRKFASHCTGMLPHLFVILTLHFLLSLQGQSTSI